MYFIIDPTRTDKQTKKDYVATFNTLPEFINYLEGMVGRGIIEGKPGMTRTQFVQDQSDYHGFSEDTDETFYDMIKNHRILMGVIKGGNFIECDVIREHYYSSRTGVHGL
jgi:hypothetical protein